MTQQRKASSANADAISKVLHDPRVLAAVNQSVIQQMMQSQQDINVLQTELVELQRRLAVSKRKQLNIVRSVMASVSHEPERNRDIDVVECLVSNEMVGKSRARDGGK